MCFENMDNFSVLAEPGVLVGSCVLPLELLPFGCFRGFVPAETCLSFFCGGNAGPAALLVSKCHAAPGRE